MAKSYIIGIVSQKGGVGKTTIAVNLATALKMLKYNVLLVDADSTNPSIGYHLGLDDANIGYRDVVQKKAHIDKAVSVHSTTGLHVLTGTVYAKPFLPTVEQLNSFRSQVQKTPYDFVIIDTAPGFLQEDLVTHFDESIMIANPDMPSLSSCIRLAKLLDKHNQKYQLVLNRIKNRNYELSIDEIEGTWKERVYSKLPEDEAVLESLAEHIPLLVKNRNNRFSKEIRELAMKYSGRTEAKFEKEEGGGIVAFIRRLLGLNRER